MAKTSGPDDPTLARPAEDRVTLTHPDRSASVAG